MKKQKKLQKKDPNRRPIEVKRKGNFSASILKLLILLAIIYGGYRLYIHYSQQWQQDIDTLFVQYQKNYDPGTATIIKRKIQPDDFSVLKKFAHAQEAEVRQLVAECLATFPPLKGFDILANYLTKDRSAKVRSAAAQTLVNYREKQTIELLIQELANEQNPSVKGAIARALRKLTGERGKSTNADYWKSWWKSNKQSFSF